MRANAVLGLCDRFHCTPEVAMSMDAAVFRMLKIQALARREEDTGGEPGFDYGTR